MPPAEFTPEALEYLLDLSEQRFRLRDLLVRFKNEVNSYEGEGGISLWADIDGHKFLSAVEAELKHKWPEKVMNADH